MFLNQWRSRVSSLVHVLWMLSYYKKLWFVRAGSSTDSLLQQLPPDMSTVGDSGMERDLMCSFKHAANL